MIIFMDYVNSDAQIKQLENPNSTKIVSKITTTNTMTTTMPIIPKMYFPKLNVTINYNFQNK